MTNFGNGFSLIELMIAVAILGVLALLGMPGLSAWMQGANVKAAAEAYKEGVSLARVEAVRRNAAARFLLGSPDANGWTVSWCQPSTAVPCNANSGNWTAVASRSGGAFSDVTVTVCPGGATEIDFNAIGWLNTTAGAPVSAIRIDPTSANVHASQVEISLSGIASQCDPSVTANADSRRCQVACP